jgi:hypothetical protein
VSWKDDMESERRRAIEEAPLALNARMDEVPNQLDAILALLVEIRDILRKPS